jgi:hypothetical protein
MKKNNWIVLVFILCSSISGRTQNVISFFEEHIDFTLDKNYFSINGIYTFSNTSEKFINQQIIFPFADETSQIDSIRIINLNTLRMIEFKRMKNAISFSFPIQAGDTVDLNIYYRQKTAERNKYIITSTQLWGKPLEKAIYTLTSDSTLKINSFSFTPDSSKAIAGKKLYVWEKYDFMPEIDFEILIVQKSE